MTLATPTSTAAILVGGLGTRLRDEVADRQKAVAEVAGRPFLHHLLDDLDEQGIRRVVLCTGHRAGTVRELVGDRHRGIAIEWSNEDRPLGTGGALARARPLLEGKGPVLVLNGDSFCDVALDAFKAAHDRRGARASVVLTRVADAARFGSVTTTADGFVTEFREKGAAGPNWINAGVYCLSQDFLRALPDDRPCSLERDVFPSHLDGRLWGYRGGGSFIDIGIPQTYRAAAEFFAEARGASGLAGLGRGRMACVDRDGTINREVHYLKDPDELVLLPGAARGLRLLQALGLTTVVVTNQAAIGRGLLDEETLRRIHDRLRELLQREGVQLDGVYYCPHTPESGCSCRKPGPELAQRAAAQHGLPLDRSYVIGDNVSDVEMGRACGATSIHVRTGHGERYEARARELADHVAEDLWCAAIFIAQQLQNIEEPT